MVENRSDSTCYPKEGSHTHVLNGGKTLILAYQFPFGLCKEGRGFFESPTKDTGAQEHVPASLWISALPSALILWLTP